jgi:methionyl-tRNA formyltransferase
VPDKPLRLVFAGTPAFAATHLAALIDSPHPIAAVYTQPDRPAGRGKKLQASAVKSLALQHGLPVRQPAGLRSGDEAEALAALQADVMVVVAYGLILPQAILDAPRLGCLNVHASLLPRWRGAAPIQRAIEAGDAETGVTIMQMDAGLDTGDMLAVATCPIGGTTTAAALQQRLAELGAPLLRRVLDDLQRYRQAATPQPEAGVTYAHKIDKTEAEIDWSLDATVLQRRIRAFNPAPVCFSWLAGERLKIWEAQSLPAGGDGAAPGRVIAADGRGILVQCGAGQLCVSRLQLPGGRPLTAQQILNSRADSFAPGTRLGAPALG